MNLVLSLIVTTDVYMFLNSQVDKIKSTDKAQDCRTLFLIARV